MNRLARLSAATLMITSLGVLTGCALDPFKHETPASPTVNLERAGRTLAQADTKRVLPVGANAPAGYAVASGNTLRPDRSGEHTVRPARCDVVYDGIDLDYLKAHTRTYLTYVNSENSLLGVGVSSRPGSLAGLANPSSRLDSCQEFVVKQGGETIRVTAKPLAFAKMGEHTLAIRFTLQAPSLAATYDAVRIQAGHNTVLADALTTNEQLPSSAELEEAANDVLLGLSR